MTKTAVLGCSRGENKCGEQKCCFQFEQVTPTVSLNTMLLGRQKQKDRGDERVCGVDVRMEMIGKNETSK